jgi:hypothetical protein
MSTAAIESNLRFRPETGNSPDKAFSFIKQHADATKYLLRGIHTLRPPSGICFRGDIYAGTSPDHHSVFRCLILQERGIRVRFVSVTYIVFNYWTDEFRQVRNLILCSCSIVAWYYYVAPGFDVAI